MGVILKVDENTVAEALVTVFPEHESPSSKELPFPVGKDILSPTNLAKNIPGLYSPMMPGKPGPVYAPDVQRMETDSIAACEWT